MSDLDDRATFCPHCARRMAPVMSGKNVVPALILAALLVFAVYLGWTFYYHPWQEYQRARILIESAYQLCFPETANDPEVQATLNRTREAIYGLDLGWEDRIQIDAAFESGLNARGCGYSARHALKPRKRR